MTDHEANERSVSRRTMLKRVGAAGALVWSVPVIQSVNMSKAFAQEVGSGPPPPEGCGNVRISLGGGCGLRNFGGGGGGASAPSPASALIFCSYY